MPLHNPRTRIAKRPQVLLEDQTLREALQIHPRPVPWQQRLEIFEQLVQAGVRRFQVGSLVRPDRMPQMLGCDELIRAIGPRPGLEVWALVLNRPGLARARASGLERLALSASLAPRHSAANLGCGVSEGLARCRELAGEALAEGRQVRLGLQCAFGGPLFAPPKPRQLLELLRPFHALGVRRLALADTAGRATPGRLAKTLKCLHEGLPGAQLGLHLHGGQAQLAANLAVAVTHGVYWLDATLAGRGGCPFLPGNPPSNLPLERAAAFLAGRDLGECLDRARLAEAGAHLARLLNDRKVEKEHKTYVGV